MTPKRSCPLNAPYLIQFPVELGRSEIVHLGKVPPEQKHEAAVVDIQGVVMAIHLCRWEKNDRIGQNSTYLIAIATNLCWNISLKILAEYKVSGLVAEFVMQHHCKDKLELIK